MKKTQDLFGSFFDLQDARLTKLKDPLAQLGEVVDWEAFRPLLSRIRPAPRHVPVHSLERPGANVQVGILVQQPDALVVVLITSGPGGKLIPGRVIPAPPILVHPQEDNRFITGHSITKPAAVKGHFLTN